MNHITTCEVNRPPFSKEPFVPNHMCKWIVDKNQPKDNKDG